MIHNVQKGDPITADLMNAVIDALNTHPAQFVPDDLDVLPLRNISNNTVPRYGVLGLGDPVWGPDQDLPEFLRRPTLSGHQPHYELHKGRWGVALVETDDGQIADFAVSGVVPTRVYVNGADDQYCDIIEGETDGDYTCYLGTGASGARILWKEDGEDKVVWALVRLGDVADDIVRCRLLEPLYDCGEAQAVVLEADFSIKPGAEPCAERNKIYLTSPMGLVAGSVLAEPGENDELCMPAGSAALARRWRDTDRFEVLAFGTNVCCESQSPSESESSRSPSESESSRSPSGSPSPVSESPVSSESPISESPVSESPVSPSQPSPSQEPPSASHPSGSDKSTAIVPASWSPTGYAALFVAESPEVRFDDVMIVEAAAAETRAAIDPRFVAVCHPGSIEVCGLAPDCPVAIGAAVEGGEVVIRLAKNPARPARVVVRLTGVRRGFAGLRFPDRTRQEFEANERFLKMARPRKK